MSVVFVSYLWNIVKMNLKLLYFLLISWSASSDCVIPLRPIGDTASNSLAYFFKGFIEKNGPGGKLLNGLLEGSKPFIPILAVLDAALAKGYTEQLNRIEENLEKGFNQTAEKIDFLESVMTKSFSTLSKESKFRDLLLYQVEIETEYSNFESIMNGYASNHATLLQHLNSFIENYKTKNNEMKIVNLLAQETYGSESLISFLIKSVKEDSSEVFNKKRTSPNRYVYDFFLSILHLVYKGNFFLSSCYSMRDNLGNSENQTFRNFASN